MWVHLRYIQARILQVLCLTIDHLTNHSITAWRRSYRIVKEGPVANPIIQSPTLRLDCLDCLCAGHPLATYLIWMTSNVWSTGPSSEALYVYLDVMY
jgi:hypothetical protein